MGHHHHKFEVQGEQYKQSGKLKTISLVLIAIGVLSIVWAFFNDSHRAWGNLLINNFYLVGLALAGILFVVLQAVTNASWSVGFRRIPEAFGMVLPIAGILLLITVIFGHHDLYHWTHEGIMDPKSENFDEIIAEKAAYLNFPFMIGRIVISILLWFAIYYAIRKNSLREDTEGGFKILKKNKTLSAVFLPVYAVTFAMFSWDVLMSIDTHWYSTIYWVYQFAGLWVSGVAAIMVTVILLQKAGYLGFVNKSHIHDLGKLMFAFSIFWAYIWLSQFLLTYYANIPEESIYYQERWEISKPMFWINFGMNFIAPFFIFMTRNAKRSYNTILLVAGIIFIGHWLDLYLNVMPGVIGHDTAHIHPSDIGMFVGFMGLFVYCFTLVLSKAPLIPVKHPFLKEFTYHEI